MNTFPPDTIDQTLDINCTSQKYFYIPEYFKETLLSQRINTFDCHSSSYLYENLASISESIDILFCATAYNESGYALLYSLAAIQKNVHYFIEQGFQTAAEKIAVCVMIDGRDKMSPSMQALVNCLSSYDEIDLADDAGMHIFDCRVSVQKLQEFLNQRDSFKGQPSESDEQDWQAIYNAAGYGHDLSIDTSSDQSIAPRVLLCIKEKNAGKLDSHRWFFKGFCASFQPKYCVQMDVGSVPKESTLYLIWQHLERHPDVGAATNSHLVREPDPWWDVLALWQFGDFTYANLLCGASEKLAGHISVLCGQFSVFRWKALSTNGAWESKPTHSSVEAIPIEAYLRGGGDLNPFESTMFLTEDRLLCTILKMNPFQNWKLDYVMEASTISDSCATVSELLQQRRRWTNGAFACQIHLLSKIPGSLFSREISSITKWHLLKMLPLSLMKTLLDWFHPSISLVASAWLFQSIGNIVTELHYSSTVWHIVFASTLLLWVTQNILALRDQLTRAFLNFSVIYGGIYVISLLMVCTFSGYLLPILIISAFFTSGCLIGRAYSKERALHILKYFLPTLLIDSGITSTILIYSFFNVGDNSWGTKGQQGEELKKTYGRYFVTGWILSNIIALGLCIINDVYTPIVIFTLMPWIVGTISGLIVSARTILSKYRSLARFSIIPEVFS